MVANSKIKMIRGHVEIHAITRWVPSACDPDVQEIEIVEFRIEHRDGVVEGALTATEAIAKVAANIDATRRKFEKRNPGSRRAWVTVVTWRNCPIGFEAPALEVRS